MKTAKIEVAAIHINCPECGEGWASPDTGAYLLSENDWEFLKAEPKCDFCGAKFKVPAYPFPKYLAGSTR